MPKNLSLPTKLLQLNDWHENLTGFDIEYRVLSNRHITVHKLSFHEVISDDIPVMGSEENEEKANQNHDENLLGLLD